MKFFRPEFFGSAIFDSQNFSTVFSETAACPSGAKPVSAVMNGRRDIISSPVAVYYELTRRCNLHCQQCFASCRTADPSELPSETVFAVLRQLAAAGVINVRFTGGEPSLRSDLLQILEYARGLGLVVSLQTNGVYDDPDVFVAKLAALACDQVTVSVDGPPDVHDALRGAGAFASVHRSLQLFAENRVPVRINLLAHRQNLARLEEIFAWATTCSAGMNIFHIRPIGRARNMQHLLLDENALEELAVRVKALQRQYPTYPVACSAIGSQRRPAPVEIPVPAGFTALCLTADGRVWPHHYASYLNPELCLGRLPDDDIVDIWSRSQVLDDFRKTVVSHFKNCDQCSRHGKSCYGFDFEALIIERQLGIKGMLCSRFSR